MSVEYKRKGKYEFTKDGHTMFYDDVLMDLKRKSYLEPKISEIKTHLEAGLNINSDQDAINWSKKTVELLK